MDDKQMREACGTWALAPEYAASQLGLRSGVARDNGRCDGALLQHRADKAVCDINVAVYSALPNRQLLMCSDISKHPKLVKPSLLVVCKEPPFLQFGAELPRIHGQDEEPIRTRVHSKNGPCCCLNFLPLFHDYASGILSHSDGVDGRHRLRCRRGNITLFGVGLKLGQSGFELGLHTIRGKLLQRWNAIKNLPLEHPDDQQYRDRPCKGLYQLGEKGEPVHSFPPFRAVQSAHPSMTKERPILFSGAMVRAILDGRKTQTRRIVKDRHIDAAPPVAFFQFLRDHCPYGQPGDRLWVRETWAQPAALDPGPTVYRADYSASVPAGFENVPPADAIAWKPSIHMPRAACRLVLEVTGLRVERLQDITYDDAIAEGMFDPGSIRDTYPPTGETGEQLGRRLKHPQRSFALLWEELNGAGAWDANPWVWVVEFRRIDA